MSYVDDNPYTSPENTIAARASTDARASFIAKTYAHLAGAIIAFVAIEYVLLNHTSLPTMMMQFIGNSQWAWLIILGGFMVVSMIANRWALSAVSPGMQYAGLGLFVVAEAIIFLPLLLIATKFYPDAIPTAAATTLGLFAVLTTIVFVTRADFSFLRVVLVFGGIAAFGFIIVAAIAGFALGPIFIYAMIALMCGYILYDTSNVLHHYRIGQHVAASLALFASVATLFWYIL
ncbi:MAG: Bax inhibitor-1 family protein, partial [Planctomycetales bacterium]